MGRIAGIIYSGFGLSLSFLQIIAELDAFLAEAQRADQMNTAVTQSGGTLTAGWNASRIAFSEFDNLVQLHPELYNELGRSTEAEFRAKLLNGKLRLMARDAGKPAAERTYFALESLDDRKPNALENRSPANPFEAKNTRPMPREFTYVKRRGTAPNYTYERFIFLTEVRAGNRRPDYVMLRYTMDQAEVDKLLGANGEIEKGYRQYRNDERKAKRRIKARNSRIVSLDINTRLFGEERLKHMIKHADTIIKVVQRFTGFGAIHFDGDTDFLIREQYHHNPSVREPRIDPKTGNKITGAGHIFTVPDVEQIPGEAASGRSQRSTAFRRQMRWTVQFTLSVVNDKINFVKPGRTQSPTLSRENRLRFLKLVRTLRERLKPILAASRKGR
jgi:hypothetical protein